MVVVQETAQALVPERAEEMVVGMVAGTVVALDKPLAAVVVLELVEYRWADYMLVLVQ